MTPEHQKAQLAYIRDERKRMAKARRLFDRYSESMRALGLHPLSRSEIEDRVRELDTMENEARNAPTKGSRA